MFALLVLVISIILIAALALTVIGVLALNRRSKEQWKSRVRATSQMVWDGTSFEKLQVSVPTRKVSFGELWDAESEVGNAYWALPPYLAEFSEHRQVLVDKVRARTQGSAAETVGVDAPLETAADKLPENDGSEHDSAHDNNEPVSTGASPFVPSQNVSPWKSLGSEQAGSRDEHPVG